MKSLIVDALVKHQLEMTLADFELVAYYAYILEVHTRSHPDFLRLMVDAALSDQNCNTTVTTTILKCLR